MNPKEFSDIARQKEELLTLLLEEENFGTLEIDGISSTQGKRPMPLSYGQERLWFLDQLEPGGVAYNMPGAVRVKGLLAVGILERVIGEIKRRHEALRTSFEMKEGQPVQVIHAAKEEQLEVVDLEALGDEEREKRVKEIVDEEGQKAFDLEKGPLIRLKLVRLGPSEHVLLFTLHHIVSDGWSMGILVREFAELYGAFAAGKPSPLKELAIQYADYAVWQRQWLRGEVLAEQLRYWK